MVLRRKRRIGYLKANLPANIQFIIGSSFQYYKSVIKELEFYHKVIVSDGHRTRWKDGDWTDDSDQMILIMRSLTDTKGKVC